MGSDSIGVITGVAKEFCGGDKVDDEACARASRAATRSRLRCPRGKIGY